MSNEKQKKAETVTDKLRRFDPLLAVANAVREPIDAPAKSSPGQFGEFMRRESEVFKENDELKNELKEFKTGALTKRIPSMNVVRSKWANRHAESFADGEFKKLKAEIDSSGGNVQPIKVRRLAGDHEKFEIIFGHRRHQACLELGLPVLAMVEEANEQQLFAEMDRENRLRKDLRPYEQGLMYRRALDEGLFPSARKMSETLGIDLSNLGKSLSLARMPAVVLEAFSSPLDIQFRWAADLRSALEKNPDFVLDRAKEISQMATKPDAKKILQILTTFETESRSKISVIELTGRNNQSGTLKIDPVHKKTTIDLSNLSLEKSNQLCQLVKDFINS